MIREPSTDQAAIENAIMAGDAFYLQSSYKQALREFMKAATMGSSAALFRLGYMVEHGQGTRKNADNAKSLYRRAAEQGEPAGEFLLGRFYYARCSGSARKLGVRYIQKAASKAYPPALYLLSTIYAAGDVVERDGAKAIACLERAAASGHLFARMSTAKLKMTGEYGVRACLAGPIEYVSVMIDAARIVRRQKLFSPLVLK